jgi:tRNA(Ile)-lysidine synthase
LRGKESDQDAVFVREWCKQRSIPFYILNKITKTVEAELRINTQTAARKIRYDWWDKLLLKHQFNFICTAHHLDDSIETLLINLFRGSGMKGLRGIPRIRGNYLRPLLDCSRQSIEEYASQNEVPFRTDSSNRTDKYQRNRIRHHLMPILMEMYPGLHSSMRKTISRINTEWESVQFAYDRWLKEKVTEENDGIKIEDSGHTTAFVLRWLEEKGFPWSLASDYILSADHNTGQFLEYDDLRLFRTDFGFFVKNTKASIHLKMHKPGKVDVGDFELYAEPIEHPSAMQYDDPMTVYVHTSVLKWPLTIRNVQPGDVFQPFGMQGKHKKIQDLMVDLKLELYEKQRLLILESEEHIIWVIGKRLDERARVSKDEQNIIRLRFVQKELS